MNSIIRYCAGEACLRTRTFYEIDDRYVCEYCRKKLYKVQKR